MKKFISLLSFVLLAMFFVGCNDDDNYVDTDTYPVVIDIRENFVNSTDTNTTNYLYGVYKEFSSSLANSDVVLIYRQDTSSGTAVWKLLPKTYYLTQGALDYYFDFTTNDIQIYADAEFNMTSQDTTFKNTYLNNQTFRVVFVPASFGKNSNVDLEDYNSVVKFYSIDDSNVQILK